MLPPGFTARCLISQISLFSNIICDNTWHIVSAFNIQWMNDNFFTKKGGGGKPGMVVKTRGVHTEYKRWLNFPLVKALMAMVKTLMVRPLYGVTYSIINSLYQGLYQVYLDTEKSAAPGLPSIGNLLSPVQCTVIGVFGILGYRWQQSKSNVCEKYTHT